MSTSPHPRLAKLFALLCWTSALAYAMAAEPLRYFMSKLLHR